MSHFKNKKRRFRNLHTAQHGPFVQRAVEIAYDDADVGETMKGLSPLLHTPKTLERIDEVYSFTKALP